ncbi:glycosyltransferase [Stenotrophomonas rhizophila]
MVGPLPPERSGIAEYSAGLVAMLRDLGLRVDTVTNADVERAGVKQVIDDLRKADAVVYQMGNHPIYHGWMLPLMARVPGIVHLHDLVLHHMVAGVLNEEQRLTGDEYASVLGKWHTVSEVKSAGLALRCGKPIWNTDDVVHFPLHQVATKFATEVVVHSQYSADRIIHEFPWLPVTVVPQLYPVVASHRVRERLSTIALMGGGQMNRRFDWIVQALVAIAGDLDHPLTLEIAGEVEPAVQRVLEGTGRNRQRHAGQPRPRWR